MDRRKNQRRAPDEYITVYDESTGQLIGSLANMSTDGLKLVTDQAIKPGTTLKCRINLETDIMGYKEIYFSAECRWCRKNVAAGAGADGEDTAVEARSAQIAGHRAHCAVEGLRLQQDHQPFVVGGDPRQVALDGGEVVVALGVFQLGPEVADLHPAQKSSPMR